MNKEKKCDVMVLVIIWQSSFELIWCMWFLLLVPAELWFSDYIMIMPNHNQHLSDQTFLCSVDCYEVITSDKQN